MKARSFSDACTRMKILKIEDSEDEIDTNSKAAKV